MPSNDAFLLIVPGCTWGVFNAVETYHTLFFQDIQHLSAIQTSIHFLPGVCFTTVGFLRRGFYFLIASISCRYDAG